MLLGVILMAICCLHTFGESGGTGKSGRGSAKVAGYPHLVCLPSDYATEPGNRWPMILFLHGSGERGNDISKIKDQGPQGFINQGHALPFIIVSPLLPAGEEWSPERLLRLIEDMEQTYRVDPRRIYVTGLSLGGRGTYDVAAGYPRKIAAIAALSAREYPEIADRLKTVPVWIFHGADDDVVPARYSREIARRLKQDGAEFKLTIYAGVGHGGWDKIYANPDLYAWFLQHSR